MAVGASVSGYEARRSNERILESLLVDLAGLLVVVARLVFAGVLA